MEPQSASIRVVHIGEIVVASLWDVMPCGM